MGYLCLYADSKAIDSIHNVMEVGHMLGSRARTVSLELSMMDLAGNLCCHREIFRCDASSDCTTAINAAYLLNLMYDAVMSRLT
jgi:hypothetical protein